MFKLFRPSYKTPSSRQIMFEVSLALLPALLVSLYLFGVSSVIQVVLSALFCVLAEAVCLMLRKRPLAHYVFDGSALLTGLLLGLSLPHFAPWWLSLFAAIVAIGLGKYLYGGLGQNPFNPAMVGLAVVLVSFPALFSTHWAASIWMSSSIDLDLFQSINVIFNPSAFSDALSGATPLDAYKQGIRFKTAQEVLNQELFTGFNGGWFLLNVSYLVGGIWLIWRKRIRWQISLALLLGLSLSALIFGWDEDQYAPLSLQLFSGATMMAAFFIATDPVSAASTPKGRWIYGFFIGVLIFMIRSYGAYPDGVAFAILLMNTTAPLIDAYTQPVSFGHAQAKRGLKKDD